MLNRPLYHHLCLSLIVLASLAASAQTTKVTIDRIAPFGGPTGTIFLLTANVSSNGTPISGGTVTFTDSYRGITQDLGSVQVQSINGSTGSAVLRKQIGGIGTHSITASVSARSGYTNGGPSHPQTIRLSPFYATATTLAPASGTVGSYTLSATLSAFGSSLPSGTMNFTDTTTGAQITSVPLDPTTVLSQFTPLPTTPVNYISQGVPAVGDFNGDGYLDFAAPIQAGPLGPGSISILLGNGDGTYTPGPPLNVASPYSAVAGDFNNDGNLDLAVLSNDPTIPISVFLGDGHGNFGAPTPFAQAPPGTTFSAMLAIGDFNNDGNLDLVASDMQSGAGSIVVLLGDGTGSFGSPTPFAVGSVPYAVAVGDLDRDGNQDLVVSDGGGSDAVTLFGKGDGTFGSRIFVPLPGASGSVAIGDFKGNGNLDIAAVNPNAQAVYVLLNNGNGTFSPGPTYSIPEGPQDVSVGDFNQDGKLDIVTDDIGNSLIGNVGVLLGNGDGTFQTPSTPYPVNGVPTFALVSDLNGDNQVDVATVVTNPDPSSAGDGLSILLTSKTATVQTSPVSVHGCGPQTVTATYNGDANYAESLPSSAITLTPSISPTTLSETVTPVPTYGQQVQLIATLSPFAYGSTSTNGELITFTDGAQPLGTAPLQNGTAVLNTTFLTIGGHNLSASYTGDCAFQGSVASSSISVGKASTTVTVAVPPTGIVGQNVTLTATVQSSISGQPTGMVTFLSNNVTVGTGTVTNGTATVSTTNLSLGADAITAVYSGDTTFAGGTSNPASITISKASVTVTTTASPTASTVGQNVTLTATVRSSTPGQPTGTVTFLSKGITVGTGTVTNGTATLNIANLPVGIDTITAIYSGDPTFAGGSSTNPTSVTISAVTGLDFTLQVTSPTTINSDYGGSPNYTFLVTPTTASGFPGTVQFSATTLSQLHAAFTFSPASLPSNAGPSTVMLSGTTSFAQNDEKERPFSRLLPVSLCLFTPLLMLRRLRHSRHLLARSMTILLFVILGFVGATSLSGCGSGIAPFSYPITVTATSGSVSHSVTVTFHVGPIQ